MLISHFLSWRIRTSGEPLKWRQPCSSPSIQFFKTVLCAKKGGSIANKVYDTAAQLLFKAIVEYMGKIRFKFKEINTLL